jgi:PHD/YefM family antitoxin component YafN of YafNO toxin-antitoxin module
VSKAMETITIQKQALNDLIRIKEEFDLIVESLELASDPEFMESLKRSKDQIERGDVVDFDEL